LRVEWSQYLNNLDLSRLEADGEVSWRLARGFSLTAGVNASRIRHQISLPRRGATPEEILLELRELQSGYEYRLSFGVTYTFGSIYSSIVNPRFGQ
jgi:long-subunit fatty acid transport protein